MLPLLPLPPLQALPLPPELAQEPELARSRVLEPELAQVHRMLRCPQPPGPQSCPQSLSQPRPLTQPAPQQSHSQLQVIVLCR